MRNFGEMTDEVLAHLRSFVRDQEMSTHLTAPVSFGDLVLPVDNATVLTRGRVQIGDELIWVDGVDRNVGTGIVPPYGRGMDGTSAASHLVGTRVIVQPLYPRKTVKDVMNQVIASIGQKLYGVEVLTLPPQVVSFAYELPAHTREVLSVRVADRDAVRVGTDISLLRTWTFDKHAPVRVSSTGKALYIMDTVGPRDDVTVTISRDPQRLMFDVQMFTESFLPQSAWDIVVLLAASRLMATADSYNIVGRSVEANALDSKVQPGAAVAQSKYLFQLGTARLEEERLRLLNSTVSRAHYSGR
jgi:hypothetical protein